MSYGQPATGFYPIDQEAPSDFYLSLPPPWNVVPYMPATPSDDLLKSIQKGRLIIFDGKKSSYDAWRQKFIACIHIKRSSPASKAVALQASLDTKNKRLSVLADSIALSDQGYLEAIDDLEAEFGGPQRLRQERLSQILKTSLVRANDVAIIHEFNLRLKAYIKVVEERGDYAVVEVEDENFLQAASRMDDAMGTRFCDYLEDRSLMPCIRNLYNFTSRELARCRKHGDFRKLLQEKQQQLPKTYSRTYVARGGENEVRKVRELQEQGGGNFKVDFKALKCPTLQQGDVTWIRFHRKSISS